MLYRRTRWPSSGKAYFIVRVSSRFVRAFALVSDSILQGYWMSDKPLVQQGLAAELAGLLLTITSTDAALAFLRGFWEAMVREWNGIDRLR